MSDNTVIYVVEVFDQMCKVVHLSADIEVDEIEDLIDEIEITPFEIACLNARDLQREYNPEYGTRFIKLKPKQKVHAKIDIYLRNKLVFKINREVDRNDLNEAIETINRIFN